MSSIITVRARKVQKALHLFTPIPTSPVSRPPFLLFCHLHHLLLYFTPVPPKRLLYQNPTPSTQPSAIPSRSVRLLFLISTDKPPLSVPCPFSINPYPTNTTPRPYLQVLVARCTLLALRVDVILLIAFSRWLITFTPSKSPNLIASSASCLILAVVSIESLLPCGDLFSMVRFPSI
uniref:Uncharacterized protein n=1 Tax=Opuntia streptacantha TaxID=393608 RepID=A0A7C9AZQ8_OPUST